MITVLSTIRFVKWSSDLERLRNEAIIYTFLYTGLRNGELRALKIIDVDFNDERITVFAGKGNKDRVIPLHPKLKIVLRQYLREWTAQRPPSKFFFNGMKENGKLNEKVLLKMCRKLSIDCEVKFTPHMLRHTFGRLLIENGYSLYMTKELMGHNSVETTLRYVSASIESIKKSFNAVQLI